ncbi:MAG: phytoene desaturase [Sandaracinaceae bacterium]|nr:phytoene desaturase [Sandaracinaceae bacterium]
MTAHLPRHLSRAPSGERSLRETLKATFDAIRGPQERLRTGGAPIPVTERSPHALVIGAGFGGLAAAVRLGARGYRVTVIDKLDQPGGRGRVFRDEGFVFDAGPTVITAPFLFEELWALAGKRLEDDVELVRVDPFYRIRFEDGTSFDYTGDGARMRAEIARFRPEDVEGYERFLVHSEKIFDVGFGKLAHVPFDTAIDMARIVPKMLQLESHRTVHGLVAKYIQDPKLRQVFSFNPLLIGGNPFTASSIYTLIAFLERKWGVWFAMGGTGQLARGLVGLIEGLGGTVRLGEEVTQITVAGRRATGVKLASGEHVPADVVVSNADSAWTYRHLVAPEHRSTWTDRKLDRARYSMSVFVWYFGTKRKYDSVAHHTILLGPRYEALLDDIFAKKILAADFSLYLHRPTATDPSMAPEGCDAFYVLSPVPHLDSGIDWRQEAERYRKSIARYLSDTVLPGLEEHLVTSRVLTPQGFLDDYLALKGAAFGLEPVLHQSAYFRPHNRSEELDNLYLVGAGTHPGAGLPGVLSSARVLDTIVADAPLSRR